MEPRPPARPPRSGAHLTRCRTGHHGLLSGFKRAGLWPRTALVALTFAAALCGWLSTGLRPASADTALTLPYFVSGDCGTGELCPIPVGGLNVATTSELRIQYFVGAQCSSFRLHIFVDGSERLVTGFLGWVGAPPPYDKLPLQTPIIHLGPVADGPHTIGLQAEGQVSGCNFGTLLAWDGILNVTTTQDLTPPKLHLPASLTVEAAGPSGTPVTFNATASDPGDTVSPVTCAPASASLFPLGTTTVNCNATDGHGNTTNGSFPVTVHDTRPPVLTLPAPIVLDATDSGGAFVYYSVTAVDTVDQLPTVSCTPASGTEFPIGTTTVSCTATDFSGNQSSPRHFTVRVRGAVPELTSLAHAVQGAGQGTTLEQAVDAVRRAVHQDNQAGACQALATFDADLQAQDGNALTGAQATTFYVQASTINGLLSCPLPLTPPSNGGGIISE